MLTIGRLASYAGVSIRAVRHYHQIGLLPEPERDASGYRSYDAAAVLRLIRIRTLAEAGVPLARIRELLEADPETFAAATIEIDRELRARIRALQEHRRRVARLGSVESLAVPAEVADYLDRLRAIGAPTVLVEAERDAWILVAARYPETIPAIIADKVAQLAEPTILRLYQLLGRLAEEPENDDLLREIADLMSDLYEEAAASGDLDRQDEVMPDRGFVRLLDSFSYAAHPVVARLGELLAERGWTGWSRVEKRRP
ncbi:MerR family transcriptional regulator [Salinispora tropica]|uniref:Transcriptional regulator, MerR family n=1 Tax=Salinispora tropica (strain ATCC BAA-916 / DSM 44818 / JCM 13857 / NBRC 105044 / CNB-440) TaxID=369723 RepID=A4XD03_SALTO|nr:MerR family transcriptional regulator [Salinispora tropica]ABP56810.1 transcriptional regulator, MerR family [Salinispora tropica CNB-440]